MRPAFEMLPKDYILRWVAGLVVKGAGNTPRNAPTIANVAAYSGVPQNSLLWMAYAPERVKGMSRDRQRLFSRVIAEIENGQVEFIAQQSRKHIIRRREDPRPIARYQVKLAASGPRITAAPRPKPVVVMPSFKDLLK